MVSSLSSPFLWKFYWKVFQFHLMSILGPVRDQLKVKSRFFSAFWLGRTIMALNFKVPWNWPWNSRFFQGQGDLSKKFQGFSRLRVTEKFQGENEVDLEKPWISRQGLGYVFQGSCISRQGLIGLKFQGFFKEFQGVLEIPQYVSQRRRNPKYIQGHSNHE